MSSARNAHVSVRAAVRLRHRPDRRQAAQSANECIHLHGAYHHLPLGLRPGLICTVFTPAP
jgi:hypothetical protein